MKVEPNQFTPAETLKREEYWYHRQAALLAQCLGPAWPTHRSWLEDCLSEEVRSRLLARGWRAKRERR